MRSGFLLVFLIGLAWFVRAQQPLSAHTRILILEKDSFVLDTAFLLKGSVKVKGYTEGLDYQVNYYSGLFVNRRIPLGTLLQIDYLPIRFPLRQVYQNKDLSIIQKEFSETKNPFRFDPKESGFDPILKSEGLLSNGSIMRGISIGNNQNTVVNSNLNLQLAGRINNDVDILAAISDDNNPIQPEGNTQELQDFDQVFVQFSKNNNKFIVGDYLMSKPASSYFLNYYKKSRGFSAQNQFQLNKKQSLSTGVQAALARGRFVRNVINGVEGSQGPYRLTGPNGEVFIIVISGTEAVYLDGEKLVRGEQNDYTVDYNSGEIVFTAKRLITQYSRIIIEFQYSDRNFARTLFALNTQWNTEKASVYLNYYTEQDNKNQPFQQNLSDSNKLLLASVGDRLENAKILSEVKAEAFSNKKILYRKIDTLGYTGIYFHAANANSDSVFYEVRFAFTGANKGNYRQGSSSSNGRVFVWVEPLNGIPQGDFEPYVQLIAPNRRQMLTLGTEMKFSPLHVLKIEAARSDNNKNLYSELDHHDDAGYALKLESGNTFPLANPQRKLASLVNLEYTDARFRYIERYRNVEFGRIWNRQLNNNPDADAGLEEQILSWRLAYEDKKAGNVFYQFGYYNKGSNSFIGLRHQAGVNLQNKLNQVISNLEYISGKQNGIAAYGSETRNAQLSYTRVLGPLKVGSRIQSEQSVFKNAKDSMLGGSYAYQQGSLFLRSRDSTQLGYFLELNARLDQLPNTGKFQDHTLAKEWKAGINYLQKNFNKLNVDIAYRDFELKDTLYKSSKPEQTILSRIEYDYGFWKRLITANTYLILGSGNELRRDFQYVEVPMGQGIYVWKDFNEDGLQQINEFQVASFADKNLANYIKVFLPSTSLIKVSSTQFNQTLNINSLGNRSASGIVGLLNRFSDQAAMRIERKLLTAKGNPFTEILQLNPIDTSIINLSSLLRNTLFFNRNNPRFGMDFGWNQQKNKSLMTNGFESRYREEFSLGARFNLSASWTVNLNFNTGTHSYYSEFFGQNNYRFQYQELKPKITYQWQQQWRIGIDYMLNQSLNLPELGGDESKVDQIGAELRYSFVKIGVLSLKYNLYQVQFKGNINSPLAYDMLQGLRIGNNQLWNVNLQQRFGNNLQINISYDGRKSGNANVVQTGKMEARYIF